MRYVANATGIPHRKGYLRYAALCALCCATPRPASGALSSPWFARGNIRTPEFKGKIAHFCPWSVQSFTLRFPRFLPLKFRGMYFPTCRPIQSHPITHRSVRNSSPLFHEDGARGYSPTSSSRLSPGDSDCSNHCTQKQKQNTPWRQNRYNHHLVDWGIRALSAQISIGKNATFPGVPPLFSLGKMFHFTNIRAPDEERDPNRSGVCL